MSSWSYKSLKLQLGLQDATLALQELALRELRLRAHEFNDLNAYLKELRERHSIMVNTFDSNTIERSIGRIRILLAVGAFETFLHEVSIEAASAGRPALAPEGASLDDLLQRCRERFVGSAYRLLLHKLVAYFVAVRNEAAHPYDLRQHAGQVAALADAFNSSETLGQIPDWLKDVRVPHSSNHMQFEHYILCSQAVKKLAFELWKSEINSIAESPLIASVKQRFSGLNQNPARQRMACISYVRTTFGLDFDEAADIVDCSDGEP